MILPLKEEYYSLLKRKISNNYYLSKTISDSALFLLKKLIKTILDGEKQADAARKDINSIQYFSSYDCFELIKNKYVSYATKEDVSQFTLTLL